MYIVNSHMVIERWIINDEHRSKEVKSLCWSYNNPVKLCITLTCSYQYIIYIHNKESSPRNTCKTSVVSRRIGDRELFSAKCTPLYSTVKYSSRIFVSTGDVIEVKHSYLMCLIDILFPMANKTDGLTDWRLLDYLSDSQH